MGAKNMSLFDLLGPIAIGSGIGVLYGSAEAHGFAFWLSLVVGVAGGGATLVAMWHITGRVASKNSPNIERHLAAMYVASFVSVLAVTILLGQGALWLASFA